MSFEIKEYNSKLENYDISQRLDDLKSVVQIQCDPENALSSEHMRGVANGLMLAWYIMREPYGSDVPFYGEQKKPGCEIKVGDA